MFQKQDLDLLVIEYFFHMKPFEKPLTWHHNYTPF